MNQKNYLTEKYLRSNYKLQNIFFTRALFNGCLCILRLQKFITIYPAQNVQTFNQSKVLLYQRECIKSDYRYRNKNKDNFKDIVFEKF